MSTTSRSESLSYRLVTLPALLAAGLCLVAPPTQWLVNTWVDPEYGSMGGYVYAVVVALFVWSVTSPLLLRPSASPWLSEALPDAAKRSDFFTTEERRDGGAEKAILILCLAAAIRIVGWVIGLRGTGVLSLAMVVAAGAVAAGLGKRRRAVSPFWLAVMFLFTLPVGRVAERLAGYGLQKLAAASACGAMDLTLANVVCLGNRIVVERKDVLADLPGAGARLLLALALVFTFAAAVGLPRKRAVLCGGTLALGSALAANALRLAVLALAGARPGLLVGMGPVKGPADTVAAVLGAGGGGWHGIAFCCALIVGAIPTGLWWLMTRRSSHERWAVTRTLRSFAAFRMTGFRLISRLGNFVTPRNFVILSEAQDLGQARLRYVRPSYASLRQYLSPLAPAATATFALVSALTVTATPPPRAPLANHRPILPEVLAGRTGVQLPLGAKEHDCAIGPGGGAAKAAYGEQVLRLVATISPLRSLRAPDECLPETGHSIAFVGIDYGVLPAAVYHDVAPDGRLYRLAVTYISDDGRIATSVAEVTYNWLWDGGGRWTAVERTSFWDEDPRSRERLDLGLAQALGLPVRGASLASEP